MIWIVIALMAAAVAGLLAFPLLRRNHVAADRAAYDLTVFRDQLQEVDRDLARGILSAGDNGKGSKDESEGKAEHVKWERLERRRRGFQAKAGVPAN